MHVPLISYFAYPYAIIFHTLELFAYPLGLKYPRLRNPELEDYLTFGVLVHYSDPSCMCVILMKYRQKKVVKKSLTDGTTSKNYIKGSINLISIFKGVRKNFNLRKKGPHGKRKVLKHCSNITKEFFNLQNKHKCASCVHL